uniref:Bestrophin homolog n=1 Tax=Odontella aurita TaxID=265563 RepID=A0A7S4J9K7_9STRA|mmetsp:Transcript_42006/g.127377  ORF Transcript_42006/g.127377 Transcript_42006/m.127377 type:complete len:371 (+) Transcript_42006:995-2107(+)|eukprot:CAMPEP_0113562390 /NCGR_PEP_ID=MMETSP0015_2-20120614/20499_1 /TAXON_ID=2838 /ORGANISM="Odontella" /LENGTH=370 /DNA_ID=CAMNT_0000464279 /DNA_START=948 /DNA_END=2060 /DNA_ORIENTATION=+ /assembly_acc=CAM_ASM_000160
MFVHDYPLLPPVFITAIAAVLVAYNTAAGGYVDFEGVKHDAVLNAPLLGMPLAPFTVVSSSLGLLLAFRTNQSFKRWDEARKNWGMNINHTRDLVRMGTVWYDNNGVSAEKRKEDLDALALATWAFVRAMKRHLSPETEDEEDFKTELREKLPAGQAEAIINAAHRPNRALFDLGVAIENLPMHWMRKNEINGAVTIFEDNLGSSERILTSPIPVFYSRHTSRFLLFWLAFLPLGLYDSLGSTWNHVGLIGVMPIISVFLIGIDELANQMEEPFTILPMQAFCDKIYNWCTEIVSWTPGDNGVEVRQPSEAETALSMNVINVEMPEGASSVQSYIPSATYARATSEESTEESSSKFARIKSAFRSKTPPL